MTAHDFDLINVITSSNEDEYSSIPIDLSDIINICREYNKLGWQIQNQVEIILECGVEEAIKEGLVKQQALPHIKNFLRAVCNNPYFGDACSQSYSCIYLIDAYLEQHKKCSELN